MKKLFCAVFALFLCAFVYGQDFSLGFGGGLLGDISLGGHTYESTVEEGGFTTSVEGRTDAFYSGAFLFFDATYAELDLAFLAASPRTTVVSQTTDSDGNEVDTSIRNKPVSGTAAAAEIGLLGKFPFRFGSFTVYPLLGVQYLIVLYAETEGVVAEDTRGSNTLCFQGGVGTDFALTENLFIRAEVLVNNKKATGAQRDAAGEHGTANDENALRIKLGVGFSL